MSTAVINPRKLAAIDIVFLGPKFIIIEFAGGVVLCTALGIFVLLRSHSVMTFALGLYLLSLGINYVPMLIYAVATTKNDCALDEIGDELGDKRRAMANYCLQSILLLIPLLVPIVAFGRLKRERAPQTPNT